MKKTIDFCGRPLTIETGEMAKQANGSVFITYGETAVLTTATCGKSNRDDIDFLPLSVDYQEKFSANGRIPGGFFKREGRLGEREILISRMTDRPIRPLFPKGYARETQVATTVYSFDQVNDSDLLGITGASAALHVSDIPFMGPIGAVRVGKIDGKLTLNPTIDQMESSALDMTVAASRDAIVMVEGQADQLPEAEILEALQMAFDGIQPLLDLQDELRAEVGKENFEVTAPEVNTAAVEKITAMVEGKIEETLNIKGKIERYKAQHDLKEETKKALLDESEDNAEIASMVGSVIHDLIGDKMRAQIVNSKTRMDQRSITDIRQITPRVTVLPRAHGSALFTRGETQALVSATLGTSDDEQRIDSMSGESKRNFMLHYNFPSFSVGEVRPNRGPGRREIGHGALATKALTPVLPNPDEFPYTIRILSDVLESNGSSSMATVCGGTLSMMDAGVPLKSSVAGIAMGLIKEENDFFVLSDISGDEDHLGDMDFKLAGTRDGITAVQMDIKVSGIGWDIISQALEQAKQGRLHILDKMDEALSGPREELSQHAPRLETIELPKDKIREVIGKGGETIRRLTEESGAKIEINDDGTAVIASSDADSLAKAKQMILDIITDPEVGAIYTGKAVRLMEYGVFVQLMPGNDGLLHVSEMKSDGGRINDVSEYIKEGDMVEVKVLEIDRGGKIKLTQYLNDDERPVRAERPRMEKYDRDDRDRGGDRDRGFSGRGRADRSSRDRGGRDRDGRNDSRGGRDNDRGGSRDRNDRDRSSTMRQRTDRDREGYQSRDRNERGGRDRDRDRNNDRNDRGGRDRDHNHNDDRDQRKRRF
jgi:polyribonucleotide nucleotidyltransferase